MLKKIFCIVFSLVNLFGLFAYGIEPPEGLSNERKHLFALENFTPEHKRIWLEETKQLNLIDQQFRLFSIDKSCFIDTQKYQGRMFIPEYRKALAESAALGLPLQVIPQNQREAFNTLTISSQWAFEQLSEDEKAELLGFGKDSADKKALSVLSVLTALNELYENSVGIDGARESYFIIKFKELVHAEYLNDDFESILQQLKSETLGEYKSITNISAYSPDDMRKFNGVLSEIGLFNLEQIAQKLRERQSQEVNQRIDFFSEHRFWALKQAAAQAFIEIVMKANTPELVRSALTSFPLFYEPSGLTELQIKSLTEKVKPLVELDLKMHHVSYGDWLSESAKSYCTKQSVN